MEAKVKGKPLTKEETKCLIDLVAKSTIIQSKETNAASNKMKDEEWALITSQFNATANSPRTVQQLRLKWENLKKNARKRSTKIRMNNIKTGGGAGDYIPPDENLDRVISLLGSTATGLEASFGGDSEEPISNSEILEFVDQDTPFELTVGETPATNLSYGETSTIITFEETPTIPTGQNTENLTPNVKPPDASQRFRKGKRKLEENPKQKRDTAIAEYYKLKKQCLEAKYLNMELENQKLKLEIENLKK